MLSNRSKAAAQIALLFLAYAFILYTLTGCSIFKGAAVEPGSDVVVVNAERTIANALAAFDAVVNFDHDNLDAMKANAPQVHEAIQDLRRKFPPAYQEAVASIRTYKQLRTPASGDAMNDKLSKAEDLAKAARAALIKAQGSVTP